MSYSIYKHLLFNTWASEQVAHVLKEVDDDVYFRENKSSFSSIAKTVSHMWGAQVVWLKRMQGVSLGTFPTNDLEHNKASSLDKLVESARDIEEFIASKDETFLASEYSYKNLKGDPFRDP